MAALNSPKGASKRHRPTHLKRRDSLHRSRRLGRLASPTASGAVMALYLVAPAIGLALVATSPTIASIALSFMLSVLSRGGLLSNIRVDSHTRVSFHATSVLFTCWIRIWGLVRAASWGALVSVHVPAIRITVVVLDTRSEAKEGSLPPHPSLASEIRASEVSLKDLRHPVWRRMRERIRLVRAICHLVSLFAVSVGSITVNVVGEVGGVTQELLCIKDGSVSVQSSLKSTTNDLAIAIDLFNVGPAALQIPGLQAMLRLGLMHFEVVIPVAPNVTDRRAPVPSSCVVTCSSIWIGLQQRALIQASKRIVRASSLTHSDDEPTVAPDSMWDDLDVLVELIECVPTLNLNFNRVKVDMEGPDVQDTGLFSLENVEFQLFDSAIPTAEAASAEQYETKVRTDGAEKTMILSAGTTSLQLRSASDNLDEDSPHSSVKISRVKLESITRFVIHSEDAEDEKEEGEDDHTASAGILSASVTITGECRGLVVIVSNRVCPWVHAMYSELPASPGPDQEAVSHLGSLVNRIAVEVETQFKFVHTEVTVVASNATCDVLPDGIPSTCLTVDEINMYGHPFIGEEQMGVRSKADLQVTRLKVFFMPSGRLTKTLFLSLDFTRVFIAPLSFGNLKPKPAQVEIEAEWLELKWAPELLHALAGALELCIELGGPILWQKADFLPQVHPFNRGGGLQENIRLFVPPMRAMQQVMNDAGSGNGDEGGVEASVVFRCTIKRMCATFVHQYEGSECVECLTADTCRMSTEELTGRFCISVEQIKVFQVQTSARAPSQGSGVSTDVPFIGVFSGQSPPRRLSSSLREKQVSTMNGPTSPRRHYNISSGQQSAKSYEQYFYAARFALEETKIRDGQNRVIDIFAEDVKLNWSMAAQLRVMEVVRKVTFASWEMLYRVRAAYARCCTSAESDYNRPFGLNPPLEDVEECRRWEARLLEVISGSGDTLHRIWATNIHVHAPLTATLTVTADIGFFGGDDLPDLWKFGDIVLKANTLETLRADTVRIRHTVAKRSDYVFGEFEAMVQLRKKMSGCLDTRSDQCPDDGMLVECDGVRLQTSVELPFRDHMNAIQSYFTPYADLLKAAAATNWRPQHDLFYRYFLRTPPSSSRACVWLDLRAISFQCLGSTFEGWLEKVYPIWMQELEERELRAQVFDEHVAALKLTNPNLISADEVAHELAAMLAEKNARSYVHKMKKQRTASLDEMLPHKNHPEPLSSYQTPLLDIAIGQVAGDMTIGEAKADTWGFIKRLDEAIDAIAQQFRAADRDFDAYEPSHLCLVSALMDLEVTSITVQMRRFLTPIFHCDSVSISGKAALSAWSPGDLSNTEAFDFTGALRCFPDLQVLVKTPTVWFCPSYVHALQELVTRSETLLPLLLLNVDKCFNVTPWDMARRLLHGRITTVVENASLRLLSSPSSFELSDYLAVSLQQVTVAYELSKIGIDLLQATAKIEPWSLSHCAEISSAKLTCWLNWSCTSGSAMHYVYPIEFRRTTANDADTFIFKSHAVGTSIEDGPPEQWVSQPSRDLLNPLQLYEATSLSVFIKGSVGCANCLEESSDDAAVASKTKREAPALTAVVLYMKHVEWLLRLGRLYYSFMQQLGQRNTSKSPSDAVLPASGPSVSILDVLSGVIVEKFDIVGIDVAIYRSEKHPIGIRTFIEDGVSISGGFLHERHEFLSADRCNESSSTNNHAKAHRLSLPGELSEWIVLGVYDVARNIQVRVCSAEAGSRGESLVFVKEVVFRAGGDGIPDHDGALLIRDSGDKSGTSRCGSRTTEPSMLQQLPGPLRREASKTILDHFEIAQHNPYHFRDSDPIDEVDVKASSGIADGSGSASFDELRRMGFLLGLFAREARVLVTFSALEALAEIGENWFGFATVHCPELFMPKPIELTTNDEQSSIGEEGSPKRATSLAEDPRFGKIFDAFVKSSDGRRGSRDAMTTSHHSDASFLQTQDTPAVSTPSLVDPILVVQFVDFQISIQDHAHKGSVVVALSRGTLKNSLSADKVYEEVALEVEGVQMFTAPLDIDVKSRTLWLKALSDGSYCPSSSGLFKRVIAPIPATLTAWIERVPNASSTPSATYSTTSKVGLKIPAIEVTLNVTSKEILQNVVMGATELAMAKLSEIKAHDQAASLSPVVRIMVNAVTGNGTSSSQRTLLMIRKLEEMRKQLRWRIALIEWQQVCRWNHYASDCLGASLDAGTVAFSPQFRRRRVTAAASSAASPRSSFSLPFADLADNDRGDACSAIAAALAAGPAESSADKSEQLADDLVRSQLQYSALSETLASMIKSERESCATQPNIEFEFSLKRAELTLSGENADILNTVASALQFSMKQYEDRSGACTLTLHELTARNPTPGATHPELLQPAYSRPGGSHNLFLRVDAEQGRPVRGTTVVKHFEVNVHPIQVCLTQDIILQLVAFFAPPAAATATSAREEDQQRRQVRSQFLQPSGAHGSGGCGSPSERLMGGAASKIKRAVRVAGKAATYPRHLAARAGSSMPFREREESAGDDLAGSVCAPSAVLLALQEDAVEWMSKIACDQDSGAMCGLGTHHESMLDSAAVDSTAVKESGEKLISFKRIRFGMLEVLLTYKNKKSVAAGPHAPSPSATSPLQHQQALEDMRGFELKIHPLVYCDKTCSATDLLLRIRRDIVLDVLSQVGRNFTNIGNLLRDQFDLSRWAPFDALAPLRSLAAVAPLHTHAVGGSASSGSSNGIVEASAHESDSAEDSSGGGAGLNSFTPSRTHGSGYRGFQLELPENHPALRKKPAGGSGFMRPSELLTRSPRSKASTSDADSGASSIGKHKKSLSSLFAKKRSTRDGGQ